MNERLQVLIVDDEYLIRNLIKMRVKWNDLNMELVGEASTAMEALEMVDLLVPDIIFTDICMPSMSGIEFSKVVIEKYPHIKIVVITGYDEFEYARSSVKIGISDFILKPIHADELMNTLQKLKEKISMERTREKEFHDLKKQLIENLPFLREKFLNELLLEQLDCEEIKEKLSYFKIKINLEIYHYEVAVIETGSTMKEERKEEGKILLSMKSLELVHKFFQTDDCIIAFFDNRRRVVIISNNDKVNLTSCCELLKVMMVNTLKCYIDIGVGTTKNSIQKVGKAYKEAIDAVNYKVIAGKNQVISYYDLHIGEAELYHVDTARMEKLNLFLNAGAKENVFEILEELFQVNTYVENSDPMVQLRQQALDIFTICHHIMLANNTDLSDIRGQGIDIIDTILKTDNLPELKNHMTKFVDYIITSIKQKNDSKSGKFMDQIIEFLNKHIDDPDLSLFLVSKEFYFSAGHLGRIFKQETSFTVVEYITKLRIERAKKLLLETDLKGYQVGEKVGICDPHYFSILFKKQTGITINEFRKLS